MYKKLDIINICVWLLAFAFAMNVGFHVIAIISAEDPSFNERRVAYLVIALVLLLATAIIITLGLRTYYKVLAVMREYYGHERVIKSSIKIGVENPDRPDMGRGWAYVETMAVANENVKRYLWLSAVRQFT